MPFRVCILWYRPMFLQMFRTVLFTFHVSPRNRLRCLSPFSSVTRAAAITTRVRRITTLYYIVQRTRRPDADFCTTNSFGSKTGVSTPRTSHITYTPSHNTTICRNVIHYCQYNVFVKRNDDGNNNCVILAFRATTARCYNIVISF